MAKKIQFDDGRLQIMPAKKEFGIGISHPEWDTLMKRIEECCDEPPSDAFAFTCFGFAGGSFLAAAAFPFTVDFVRKTPHGTDANIFAIVAQVAFGVFVFAAILQGVRSLQHRASLMKSKKTLRTWVLEDMEKHKDRYAVEKDATEPAASSAP